jgi:hypothetical protein
MVKKDIVKPKPKKSKINEKAIIRHSENAGKENPVFSFLHVCDNHCLLSAWQGQELLELISTFKTMESLTWNDLVLKRHRGLDYRKEEEYTKPLPPVVSQDVDVCRVKVDGNKKRLWGYRTNNVFRILWFDREHEVIPYHKQKAH